jgi:nitrite reductase/ring-hydroxylating ferredoxin subunit
VNTATWIATVDESALRADEPIPVYPKGVGVLLIDHDGAVYAVRNACAHLGCPLEAGAYAAGVLTCPCHDWRFDVRSGALLEAPELGLPTYRTRVVGGKIEVEWHDREYAPADAAGTEQSS